MAIEILPTNPPAFPDAEIEELVCDAFPDIVDHPMFLAEALKRKLRISIDKTLVAYLQADFLTRKADELSPLQQWEVAELISENYRSAFHNAQTTLITSKAYYSFLRRMDIECIGNYERARYPFLS